MITKEQYELGLNNDYTPWAFMPVEARDVVQSAELIQFLNSSAEWHSKHDSTNFFKGGVYRIHPDTHFQGKTIVVTEVKGLSLVYRDGGGCNLRFDAEGCTSTEINLTHYRPRSMQAVVEMNRPKAEVKETEYYTWCGGMAPSECPKNCQVFHDGKWWSETDHPKTWGARLKRRWPKVVTAETKPATDDKPLIRHDGMRVRLNDKINLICRQSNFCAGCFFALTPGGVGCTRHSYVTASKLPCSPNAGSQDSFIWVKDEVAKYNSNKIRFDAMPKAVQDELRSADPKLVEYDISGLNGIGWSPCHGRPCFHGNLAYRIRPEQPQAKLHPPPISKPNPKYRTTKKTATEDQNKLHEEGCWVLVMGALR